MSRILHPRPNPIVAALYTLRDLDVDVIVMHGPSGCAFMASRMLEEAGVRVVSTAMNEDDLIFGAIQSLREVLSQVDALFSPRRIGVVGTCVSMIIGEDLQSLKNIESDTELLLVDVHGCLNDNTKGAIMAMEAAFEASIIDEAELERQIHILDSATTLERSVGMARGGYISPERGPSKILVSNDILQVLGNGGSINVLMNAKKELAYRFADINLAIEEAKNELGGQVNHIMNLDSAVGLPRIRRYAQDILTELSEHGIHPIISGGLDEYATLGDKLSQIVDENPADLLVVSGIAHAYPALTKEDILITDQARILASFLSQGYVNAVGEIASHSLVMGTRSIIPSETGEVIRELLEQRRN